MSASLAVILDWDKQKAAILRIPNADKRMDLWQKAVVAEAQRRQDVVKETLLEMGLD